MNNTDLLLLNRSDRDYSVSATKLQQLVADTDLLLIHRSGKDFKVSGKDLKTYIW